MMKQAKKIVLITLIGLATFISCSNKQAENKMVEENVSMFSIVEDESSESNVPLADNVDLKEASSVVKFTPSTIVPNFIATSAAAITNDDGIHKFVRTAHLKFKVKDVPKATQTIEEIIIKNKGFIVKSSITNENPSSRTINISKDSAVVIYSNNLSANLELRVSSHLLDSTLRLIAPLAILIDYRTLEANDVTVQLMSDKLKQERLGKKQKRVSAAIDHKGRKLDDVISAEESLDSALEEADRTKLSEYTITDQIAFSNIHITLYQDRIEYKEKVLRGVDDISMYEPGFASKVLDALSAGWHILSAIFLFLINIWPILLMLAIAAFIYFKIKKKTGENH